MCSASQPWSRPMVDAMRSAKHFLPSSALPPARAEAPDLARLGVVDDVLGGIAGPGHVGLAVRQRLAHRMDAGHEVGRPQHVIDLLAHARHDAHVDDHIGLSDSSTPMCAMSEPSGPSRTAPRTACGRAWRRRTGRRAWRASRRIGPVVGGAGVLGAVGTDEGAVLDAGHVGRVGTGQERIRPFGGVQAAHGAGLHHLLAETVVFLLRTVAPDHPFGLGQRDDAGDPVDQSAVLDMGGHVQGRQALPKAYSSGSTPCLYW